MTVKEWRDRLVRQEHISGLVIATRFGVHVGEAIYLLDRNNAGDVILWSVPPSTWPRGLVTITIMPPDILHDATVLRHVGQDWAVYDGDVICINGIPYGLGPECWVTATKKLGNASPYPFDGVVMQGSKKTDQLVQFMLSEVRRIKRLEVP